MERVKQIMLTLLREPVVHFAVVGVAIFAWHSLQAAPAPTQKNSIQIASSDVQALVQTFQMTWRRAPTHIELQRLIDERILEEVYYREALQLGLEADDPIIRRRLRQKMEFLVRDLALPRDPSEPLLLGYFDQHREDFRTDPTYSFEQVYFREDAEPARAANRAVALRDMLNTSTDSIPANAGDPLVLKRTHTETARSRVAATFGQTFADALAELRPGRWHAPVRSGYGVHAVRVTTRRPGRIPDFAEIADVVQREWELSERDAANRRVEQELLGRYQIDIEMPPFE